MSDMDAALAKLMDWSAIQVMTLMMPANQNEPRLYEAVQFLNSPDFVPSDSQPAKVQFKDPLHFNFPTPRPCDFAENNVVHGRLYRCGERWQDRPVFILLPGFNDSASYHLRFPLLARCCNRAGFNVATLVPPYHFQRSPPQAAAFGVGDYLLLAQRTAQGIAEIRALTGWLLAEGCPAVALWGQPDIWPLPHGHVSVCCGFVPGLPNRILGWLSSRLNNSATTEKSHEHSH